MAAFDTNEIGRVSRGLPQPTADGQPAVQRLSRYGGAFTENVMPKMHTLCDEGTYFVSNNSGTGVATIAAPTSFTDTAPLWTINNLDTAQNNSNKRIYLDWLRITETAAGTGGVDLRFRGVLDYTVPSGGTALTSLNLNTDVPKSASIATTRILPTGIAQSGNSRVIIGTLIAIPTQTTPLAALSEVFLNFGGIDTMTPIYSAAASANVIKVAYGLPPIIIGPGASFALQFLITSQSAASSWTVEAGWWER